ncbi:related to beta 1,4-mannosyltransferase (egghead protein) [Ustilago trichophora]|uniref:Related to beta 1,4-mannosyltransferase (Egghead protein) n=1 Tax=Ustilago trichophora TaxID=86804 RepID=A0A5C3EAB2_9BASI|nr:related to beta 1,4-mannosyltransferase (egghead protein) [Ustilago trichophora]
MPYPTILDTRVVRSSTLTPHGELSSLAYTPGSESPGGTWDRTATATPTNEKSNSVAEFKAAKDSAGAIGSAVVKEERSLEPTSPQRTLPTDTSTTPMTIENGTPVGILRSPIGLVLFYMLSGRLNATSYFRNKALVECGTHAFDQTVIAEGWLQSGNLGYPLWCNVDFNNPSPYASDWKISTSLGDIVVGLLRLATNRDYLQQLLNTSMLWSIVPQLWGMLSVLMLLPIVMFLKPSRRFGYTYNQNIPFMIGAVAADLKASGYIKKFNQKSRLAFLATEFAMAAFFVAAYCYNPIFTGIDTVCNESQIVTVCSATIYRVHGRSHALLPHPAGTLYYWLEMSVVLQWLIGNWAFKALGRVALGFYVCQMSIIYGIMPYLVIYFRDRGYTFWSNMWSTWAITFFSAYVVAWLISHTLDKWAMIFSDWFASTIIRHDTWTTLKMAAINTFRTVVYGPPAVAKATPGWFSDKWTKTKHFFWVLFHWRTMVEAPAPPSHPMEVGLQMNQLHSTLFDADISDDEQAVRTRWMLRALSYMGPIQVLIILGLGFIWMWFNPWSDYILNGFADFSTVWRLLWALALPYCIITTLGFATPDITRTPEQQMKKPVVREHIHRLFIVSVTRGSNPETTRRAHLHLKKLEKPRRSILPSSMNMTPYDWVLHMDEESTMDAESLRGCFDFIRYNTGTLVKNKVTWDFGSLAEDFEFSQAAWSKGFTLGRIHGVVREQSPEGWMDFIKQRRRWYMGIRGIMVFLPASDCDQALDRWYLLSRATLINIPFSLLLEWSGPTPRWLYVISCFCFGNFYWLYYSGLFFSEIDYGYKWHQMWQIPVHAVALLILQPIMAFVEGMAVVYAMSTEDGEVGFQVSRSSKRAFSCIIFSFALDNLTFT